MCPNGLGNPNASCRFHRAFDNLPKDKLCPTCKLALVKSTDPNDKITMTVMGEEDIEPEIIDRDETAHRTAKLTQVDAQIATMDIDGEFATTIAREKQRTQRKENAESEIARKKRTGYFLTSLAQVDAYRVKRKENIRLAIIEAKKFEDV